MIAFFSSSPCIDGADRAILNPENGFLAHLRHALPETPKCLFICSNPDDRFGTCRFGADMFLAFAEAGMPFSGYQILDGNNHQDATELIAWSDLIILAGGHVPTQNRFFQEINLASLIQGYEGVVLGISAGTMNAAEIVYAQPEESGESIDPDYQRFVPGLGLTKAQVCPHYQKVKHYTLDGQRLFEDITYGDSMGHTFFALPDGSYILSENGQELLFGEAYRIRNGILEQVCINGKSVNLAKLY